MTLLALGDQEHSIGAFPVGCKGPFGMAFADQQHWLYVACWDHSQIALIDTAHRTPTRIFSGGTLPAWIQTRPGSNETWVSDEARGTVTLYRSGTSTSLATIGTAAGPSDIAFDATGRQAWVSNETAGSVSHIDTAHRRKLADIPVGNVPQGMALTEDGKLLLVAQLRLEHTFAG